MSDMSVSSTPSGMTGAGGGDRLRIVGMATGLDVDGIIEKMMKPYQLRISNEKIRLQKIQWKQEAYRDIIKDIKEFQDEFFNVAKSKAMVSSAENYTAYTAESSDSSVASAITSSNSVEGVYNIEVISLAKTGEIKSSSSIVLSDGSNTQAKLSDSLSQIGINVGDKISFKITNNGNVYEKTIEVTSDSESIGNFMSRINTETDGLVKTAFDEISGKVIFNSNNTGSNSKIEITNVNENDSLNNILSKFKLAADKSDVVLGEGKNAHFKITSPYGGQIEVTDNQNNIYSVNGMTICLENKEGTVDNPAKTSITIKADDDAPVKLIKSFIEKYNALVDKIQTKLTEKRKKEYSPLTDEQKKVMSKDEIEKWEAKAKEGIIKSDPLITEMMMRVRSAFFSKVEGVGINFGKEIGLDTSSGLDENNKFVSSESGKILFTIGGEEKLKEALRNHRKEITDLFTKTSDSTDEVEKYSNQGIFSRINDILMDYVGRTGTSLNSAILTSAANKQNDVSIYGGGKGDSLPDQIHRQNLYIKKITDKMTAQRERYYKQFSVLETAMQKLNAQSAWLYQQYGGQ